MKNKTDRFEQAKRSVFCIPIRKKEVRYYDPNTCRFISSDVYLSTGQGVIGHNSYAYCNNNVINSVDSDGERSVRIINKKRIIRIRDVSNEVDAILIVYAATGRIQRQKVDSERFVTKMMLEVNLYLDFKRLVDHKAMWDIKRKKSWEKTIGTAFPGSDSIIIYRGMCLIPEQLGNVTYGYLCAAYGIPLKHGLAGSYAAAGFPIKGNKYNNELEDWKYIEIGYNLYLSDFKSGKIYNSGDIISFGGTMA